MYNIIGKNAMKQLSTFWKIISVCIALCSCVCEKNAVEPYSEDLSSVLILETDTMSLLLTDYSPTMERWDSITSSSLTIQAHRRHPEKLKVIVSTDSLSLHVINIWSAGRNASIIARTENKNAHDTQLYAFTIGQSGHSFQIYFSVLPEEVLVSWQSQILSSSSYRLEGQELIVNVPPHAKNMKRSFIRVFAAKQGQMFNDLLVPLENGRVLSDISEIQRTDKHAQIIYSLMIDRFCNGDPSNDMPLNRPDVLPFVDFQGGDFQGITKKIETEFFTNLGINTIWITPIAQNPDDPWGLAHNPDTKFSAYHGYWPIHPTVLNPHFGTEEQLKKMLREAHKRNINVIVDNVANHLHQDSPILKEHPDWTTPKYTADGRLNVRLFDEERLTTWFDTFLPTLDLRKSEVREAMVDSAIYWLRNYDFDGFRHDAAKHIPESYWRLLTKRIRKNPQWNNLYQIGETYGSRKLVRSYVKSGMLDGQFDFNVYHKAVNTFGLKSGDMRELNQELYSSLNNFGYHNLMGYISGNHDKPRFISVAGGTVSLNEDTKAAGRKRKIMVGDPAAYDKLALLEAFMLTVPGVPCIYQGDEYGVPGANDPDNRRMMQFDNYSEREAQHLNTVKQLIKLRRESLPLIYGDIFPLFCDKDVMAFARVYMGETIIAAYNRSGETKHISMSVPDNLGLNGLSAHFGAQYKVNRNVVNLTLPAYRFEILH